MSSIEVWYTTVALLDSTSMQKAEAGAQKLHGITEKKQDFLKVRFETLKEREQWEKYLKTLEPRDVFCTSEIKTQEKNPIILSMKLQTKLPEFEARMTSAKAKDDGTHFTFCFSDESKRLAWEEMVETL